MTCMVFRYSQRNVEREKNQEEHKTNVEDISFLKTQANSSAKPALTLIASVARLL